jgi:uncharacterized protein (TIGR00369 family)
MADEHGRADQGEMAHLVEQFKTRETFENHVRNQIAEVSAGHAELFIDIEPFHLNGNGTLHGGMYATLIDNAMGFAVADLTKVRIATTQMNVHFLAPISSGRIICTADVVHRTRRTATAEAKVRAADGTLLAMGTGAFRVFEQQGTPIV